MTIPERLDRLVHKARLDLLTPYGAPRPRNVRWLPLLLLAALPAGYWLLVATLHAATSPHATLVTGYLGGILFWIAFVGAQVIRMLGPRVGWERGALDERELILKARAGSISGMVIAVLCTLGCFYGGYAAVFGAWMPRTAPEWVYLGLMIQAYALALPVLVASWLQPAPDAEE